MVTILLLNVMEMFSVGGGALSVRLSWYPIVDAVVAVTVIRILLFVLRECEGARVTENAGVVDGDVVSAGYVSGTRGSGIVSSAVDVLGMCVVRVVRGVSGVYEMCTNPVRAWGVLDVCSGCGGVCVGSGYGDLDRRSGRGGVVLCLCEL